MEEPPVADAPKPPRQIEDYDLATQPARLSDNPPVVRFGRPGGLRDPEQIMRDMGFCPNKNMNPMQFLIAVMNDDTDKLYKQEKKRNMMRGKGIGLNYRITCAQAAARYMHMALPQVQIQAQSEGKFADELAEAVSKGNMRVERKTVIMETVERVSPDLPIPDASYPPAFAEIQGQVIEETLDMEGSTDYDPDRDD